MSEAEDFPMHHFQLEHQDEPHCYVCRHRIEIGELIELRNVDGVIVWRHQGCIEGRNE